MARVTRGVHSRKQRRAVLARAKGFRGARRRRYRVANETILHAMRYAYRDRRVRKRDFRRLWITRINAGARQHGLSYSQFMNGLRRAEIEVDRKILADLAATDPVAFGHIAERAKAALAAK